MSYRKVFCLFEQSGTFKKEFHRLGIPAIDYDLLNDFNETDVIIDLFKEINSAYWGYDSIFDKITQNDLIIAFFPCTYFSRNKALDYLCVSPQTKGLSDVNKVYHFMEQWQNQSSTMDCLCKLFIVCYNRNLPLIIENPYGSQHMLCRYFPIKPSIVITDRRKYGDYFTKPTQFFFVNCEPNMNFIPQPETKITKKLIEFTNDKVERSMISPEFARYFIEEYIL